MQIHKGKKDEGTELANERKELTFEDLENVSGTGEFDEVPTIKESDYDNETKERV